MKKYLILSLSLVFVMPVLAEQKIAFVDMQKAIQTVSAGKAAKKKIETEFKKKQDVFKKQEAELVKMKESLEKKALAYTEDQKRKKAMEFNQKMMTFRESVGRSQQAIQIRERELTLPIIEELREQVVILAKSKAYAFVLEKGEQNVMYANKDYDLTGDVVKAFEKSWKKKKKK